MSKKNKEYCPVESCRYHKKCFPYKDIKDAKDGDYFWKGETKDELETILYDGSTWEVGHFGCEDNGYSAYGFRQDGLIIRVTSKYEADIFLAGLRALSKS